MFEFCEVEVRYTEELYDGIGLTEDVEAFLHHNANKALQILSYEALFPPATCEVNPAILAALSPDSKNYNFVSGSFYVISKAVAPWMRIGISELPARRRRPTPARGRPASRMPKNHLAGRWRTIA